MSYTQILYPQLRDLLDQGAQLVEVLPADEYAELHLPDAISIPLKTLDANTTADLDRGVRPVSVKGEAAYAACLWRVRQPPPMPVAERFHLRVAAPGDGAVTRDKDAGRLGAGKFPVRDIRMERQPANVSDVEPSAGLPP